MIFSLLRSELGEIAFSGPRARFATAAALSVMLAVLLALWLRLDNIWWAGITGFACSQADRAASASRATWRVVGTLIGAAIGLAAVAWLIDDHPPLLLFLLACGMLGVLGTQCSAHPYAWLLGAVTAAMVVTASMPDPSVAVHIAAYRSAEIVVGAAAALAVAFLLHGEPGTSQVVKPPYRWSDALSPGAPPMAHAVRTGVALMLVPLAWNWLELPGLSQMAVSIAAVMAVPAIGSDGSETRSAVLQRARHRVAGCVLGGVAGLLMLALSVESLVVWLLLLTAGVWVCGHVNQSKRGLGYVGVQANVAYIVTMMQGWAPPLSPLPAIARLAGMAGGLALLMIVLFASWPGTAPAQDAA